MSAVAQRSFARGEVSPSIYAKTDLSAYQTGLRTCRNFLIAKHGGAVNRPGTEFIKEVKSSATAVRLVRFAKNAATTYLLEFGNQYIRFYQLGEVVPIDIGTSGWVFPHFYSQGETVVWLGINYVNITGNSPNVAPVADPTNWYPLSGTIYEIPTPYVAADLPTLQFVQSGDVITIVHPNYAPRQLTRNSSASWALTVMNFNPLSQPPQSFAIGAGGAAGAITYWAITSIATETLEESLAATASSLNKVPSAGAPVSLSWLAPASGPVPQYYRIYRSTDGVSYGLVGQSSSGPFSDTGAVPDYFTSPPQARSVFDAVNKYPSAVTYYQQRLIFGASNLEPETVWGSKTAHLTNFLKTFPLQDDDAVTFTLAGQQQNQVVHLRDLGRLFAFTAAEVKRINGDEAGILRPDAVNPQSIAGNGAGFLPPIKLGTPPTAIYQQARGTIIRDLTPISAESYEGTDLTVFAAHLFQKYSLIDWDYAENPNSIVWVARSDGTFLGLTYLREHGIWAWHRHDTDGIVENICVVPESTEDKVYLVVRRTINGATKRYIERLAARAFTDVKKAIFMDAAYPSERASDNPSVIYTVTLSGGTNWDESELLTATKTAGPAFSAGDVGNSLFLTSSNGTEVEFRIEGFTDATHLTGHVNKSVPTDLQGLATSSVIKGILTMTGLGHLEGKRVAVFADGYVVASPNNADYTYQPTVTGGQITLERPYKFVRVGLPLISDLVTLDLDAAGVATIKDRKILVNRLGIYIEESRGIWAGMPDQPTTTDPLHGLQEYKARSDENYSDPVATKTDFIDINIEARWDQNGRQMIRQVDPLPLTVLAIYPIGYLS